MALSLSRMKGSAARHETDEELRCRRCRQRRGFDAGAEVEHAPLVEARLEEDGAGGERESADDSIDAETTRIVAIVSEKEKEEKGRRPKRKGRSEKKKKSSKFSTFFFFELKRKS